MREIPLSLPFTHLRLGCAGNTASTARVSSINKVFQELHFFFVQLCHLSYPCLSPFYFSSLPFRFAIDPFFYHLLILSSSYQPGPIMNSAMRASRSARLAARAAAPHSGPPASGSSSSGAGTRSNATRRFTTNSTGAAAETAGVRRSVCRGVRPRRSPASLRVRAASPMLHLFLSVCDEFDDT